MPDHEPGPQAAVPFKLLHTGNLAALMECKGLAAVGDILKSVPRLDMGRIVIGVGADDVAVIIAGIPAVLHLARITKYPYQICKSEFVGVSVIHHLPEADEIIGAALASPEPTAVELVKGSPEYGNAAVTQFGESRSRLVPVGYHRLMLGSSLGQQLIKIGNIVL